MKKFKETSKSQMLFNVTSTVKLTNDEDVNIQIHVKDRPGAFFEGQKIGKQITDVLNGEPKVLKFREQFQLSMNVPYRIEEEIVNGLNKLKFPYTRATMPGAPMLTEFNIVFPGGMKDFLLFNEYLKY